MAKIGDVMMGLVFVALATTLVIHPNTSTDINSAGDAFSSSIKAAVSG